MELRLVRLSMGRDAGTVQSVPAVVAERLIAAGHAEAVTQHDPDVAVVRDADPDVSHGDPPGKKRRRA